MAKFLNTTGVSYHLEELIKGTTDKLVLISPYLQFNERIKEHIRNLNVQKKDIRIVFRENKLAFDENNWLSEQIGVRTSICKNLHAKCYMNEKEAIITSMNLYQFSQANNNEMGIYITKEKDPELFAETVQEVHRLITISDEIRMTVEKVRERKAEEKPSKPNTSPNTAHPRFVPGFCIRTGEKIPFNLEKPMNYESFKMWEKFGNPDYPEKFCHFSGESSNGETSIERPILKKNWKLAQEKIGF